MAFDTECEKGCSCAKGWEKDNLFAIEAFPNQDDSENDSDKSG